MIPSNYDGPSNGDYVAYVDKLMRASPDFRRSQRSIAGAIQSGGPTPGAQAESPMGQLRAKLQQAREVAEQAARNKASELASVQTTRTTSPAGMRTTAGTHAATGGATTKEEAKQRFRAIEREIENQKSQAAASKGSPWFSPFSVVLIVAGIVVSQFAGGFGAVLSLMGLFSLIGGVLNKLKGK